MEKANKVFHENPRLNSYSSEGSLKNEKGKNQSKPETLAPRSRKGICIHSQSLRRNPTILNGISKYLKQLESALIPNYHSSSEIIPLRMKTEAVGNNKEPLEQQNNSMSIYIEKPIRKCCCWETQQSKRKKMSLEMKIKWLKFMREISLVNNFIQILKDIQKAKGIVEEIDAISIDEVELEETMKLDKSILYNNNKNNNSCIILPNDKIGWIWSILIILLLLWSALYLPYRLAFLDEIDYGYFLMELIIDILFGVDIIVNFLTAYYDEKNILITSKCKIAKMYLKTWFVIDLLSIVPFQYISGNGQYTKSFRLLRLPRLYKLLKVLRLFKMFKQSEWYHSIIFIIKLNAGLVRLMNVLIIMCFLAHFYACLWYFIAKFDNFNPNTWVMRYGIMDRSNSHKYIFAFYWVLQTLTTVGYGDMPIGTDSERIIAITLMIGGVGFYSYTIGNLSSIFSKLDSRNSKLNSKIMALNSFAVSVKMESNLYFKILELFKRQAAQGNYSNFDQNELLDELPSALKNDVLNCTHKKILNSFSFFQNKPNPFIMKMLPKLAKLSLSVNEAIYREGDLADERRVAFITEDGCPFRNFVSGTYFGEQEMFRGISFRDYTVISMEDTEILGIKKADLENALELFPEIREEMTNLALRRMHRNMMAINITQKVGIKLKHHKMETIRKINGLVLKPSIKEGARRIESLNSSISNLQKSPLTESAGDSPMVGMHISVNEPNIHNTQVECPVLHLDQPVDKTSQSNHEESSPGINSERLLLHSEETHDYDFQQIIHNKPNFLQTRINAKEETECERTENIMEENIFSNRRALIEKSKLNIFPLQKQTKNSPLYKTNSLTLPKAPEMSKEYCNEDSLFIGNNKLNMKGLDNIYKIIKKLERIMSKSQLEILTKISLNVVKLSKIEDKMFEHAQKGGILW